MLIVHSGQGNSIGPTRRETEAGKMEIYIYMYSQFCFYIYIYKLDEDYVYRGPIKSPG